MGEIGLAGELRRVRDLPQRLAEAARLGFQVAVVPREPGAPTGRARPTAGRSTACGSLDVRARVVLGARALRRGVDRSG